MAKFKNCAALPTPGASQWILKSRNRFGCFYALKNTRPKRATKTRTSIWTPIMHGSPFDLTRNWLRRASYGWKRTLTTGQRTAWKNWAAGVTIYNYKGIPRTATGYTAYMKFSRGQRFLGFNPYSFNAQTFSVFAYPAPPQAWTLLPAPIPDVVTNYGTGSFGITFSNVPNTGDIFILGTIAKLGTPHTRPARWYMAWIPVQTLDPTDPTHESIWQTDFPYWTPDTNAPAELSMWYYDGAGEGWGPYTYLTIT